MSDLLPLPAAARREELDPMRLRPSFVALALALVLSLPVGASAQATSSTPRSETASHPAESSGTATRSAATSSDPTTRPVSDARGAQEPPAQVPVNEEDDGRKADFIWVEVDGGVSYVDLIALQTDDQFSTSLKSVRGWGPTVGVGLGFRIFFLAIGARATLASYPGFELGTIGGEVQLRLPTPLIEPWVRVGAGYAWQGNADYAEPTASTPTVYGWMLNGSAGVDIFITWWLSLGIGGGIDFLNMTRQTDPRVDCMMVTSFCPEQDGDAIGVQARAFAQAGLHF